MPANGRSRDAWRGGAANASGLPALPAGGNSRRWLLAAFVVLGIAGVIAGAFFFLRGDDDPVFLVLPVAEYADPAWSPNPWAIREARTFRERVGDDATRAFPDQDKARLLRALAQVVEDSRGPKKGKPIVVSLCVQGVAVDGVPYLLPADAKPDDRGSWLKLDDVLTELRKTDVPRLLILDVRPVNASRAPVSTSDVNAELDILLTKLDSANDLPFHVLNAGTPSNGAVSLRPLKSTAFGLAMAQALGGHADGWNTERRKDGRASALELTEYVRGATYAATAAVGAPQLPKRYGKGQDFFLRLIPKGGPAALPTQADPEPIPDFLADSAKHQDAWEAGKGAWRAPMVASAGRQARVQAERQWRAGEDVESIRARFAPGEQTRRAAMAAAPAVVPPIATFTQWKALPESAAKLAAAEAVLAPVWDKIRVPPAKPEDFAPIQQAAWGKGAELAPEAVCGSALAFAYGFEDASFDQLRKIADTVAGFRPKVEPAEWALFSFIASASPERVKQWPPGTHRRVVLLIAAFGPAFATDGRNLPWQHAELTSLASGTAKSFATLLDPEASRDAIRAAANTLDELAASAVRIREYGTVLSELRAEREDARAELGDWADGMFLEFAPDPSEAASAYAALAEAYPGADALLRPGDVRPLPDLLRQSRNGLRSARGRLRATAFVPPNGSVAMLEGALAWPGWSTAERRDLQGRCDRENVAATAKALAAWPVNPGPEPSQPAKAFRARAVLKPIPADMAWTQPAEEAAYRDFLGRSVFGPLAAAFRTVNADGPAKTLERLARESIDWAKNNVGNVFTTPLKQ